MGVPIQSLKIFLGPGSLLTLQFPEHCLLECIFAIAIWTHDLDELNRFLENLNSSHPTIEFIMEQSNEI